MTPLAATGPNAKQIEYWNGPVGERWATLAKGQEPRLSAFGDDQPGEIEQPAGIRRAGGADGDGSTGREWMFSGSDGRHRVSAYFRGG